MGEKRDLEKAAEQALQFAAARGVNDGRASFLEAMTVFLTETLDVHYAFVARLADDNERTVNTLGLAEKSTVLPNVSYPLAGSPCENVITNGMCQHSSNIQSRYPDDPMLVDMGGQSYVGVVLPSIDGEPVGHLAVIDKDEMPDTEGVARVLSILSTCTAWEIERTSYESKIQHNERRFRDFAEATSDWLWEMDASLRFTYFSPSLEKQTNFSESDFIGKTRWELAGADPQSDHWRPHVETMKNREPFRGFEYRPGPLGGTTEIISVSGIPVFDKDGTFAGYRGTASEISEEKALQNALRESDARYNRAMNHAAIWEWEIPMDRVYASTRLSEMLGYQEEEFREILDVSLRSLIHPDDLPAYLERVNTLIEYPDTIFESEHRLRQKSGEYRWFETRGSATRNDKGEAMLLSGLIIDVTDRKEMEQSLSQATERAVQAERRLYGAVNSIQDGFAIYDADDKFVMCNETYKKMNKECAHMLVPGTPYEDILQFAREAGQFGTGEDNQEELIRERLAIFKKADTTIEQQHNDGRWIRSTERRTPDGDTVCVRIDVTMFKHAQEIAESANKAKSEFLSSMSHELRTPLNAILGFGQLLRNDGKNPLSEPQQRAVKHILNSGGHLLTLIDDVLDLAKIEAGQERLSIEHTEIGDVIESCLSLVQATADKAGITITKTIDPKHSTVMADYTRLKQVIVNLLTNAIKYNSENGSVRIVTSSTDGMTRINVIDTGPGIPKDRQDELFQPFSRLGFEVTEIEGTGIGLTLSKRLVELMEGEIGFESEAGKGSTFWVQLPTATTPKVEPSHEEHATIAAATTTAPSAGKGHRFSVLYVEDNPTNIRLMEQIIDLVEDADLKSTYTAENALEMVAAAPPDLILMDINLPGMNGIQALNRLRASEQTRSIPVIAISADAIPASIQRGLEAGFHAYLTKPIRVDEILDIIESLRAAN